MAALGWLKREGKKYPTIILKPEGAELRKLDSPVGRPWMWRGKLVWVTVPGPREKELREFIPPERRRIPKKEEEQKGQKQKEEVLITPSDLMFLLDQTDVRELLRPTSTLLQKIELGILVALTLGLGFLMFVVYSSIKGG